MRFVGFFVGFAVVAALEYLLLAAMGAIPRGPGWVVLPVVAGIALSRATPDLVARLANGSTERAFYKLSAAARLAIIGAALWLLAVPAYVFLFNPYGSYMASYDYLHMFKVMLFPVAIIAAGYFAYSRFFVGNFADNTTESRAEAPHLEHRQIVPPPFARGDLPSDAGDEELMQHYGITRENGQYAYQTYRFDQLKHALAHAQHVESLRQRA